MPPLRQIPEPHLVRLRRGFLFREHRNQYRLRRGMDRLHEANKVANVMRRRENPRPIPAERLIRPGQQTPRNFPESKPFQHPADAGAAVPPLALASTVHLPGSGPLDPHPAESLLRHQTYPACPFPLPAAADLSALVFQGLLRTSMPESAPPLAYDLAVVMAPKPLASGFDIRDSGTLPIIRRIQRPSPKPAPVAILSQGRPARTPDLAHGGRDLRVSMAAAFRVPASPTPPIPLAGPDPAGAAWLPAAAHSTFSAPDYSRPRLGTATVRTASVELNEPALRVPAIPAPRHGGFRWPGTMEMPTLFIDSTGRYRALVVPFGDENPGKERFDEYRN